MARFSFFGAGEHSGEHLNRTHARGGGAALGVFGTVSAWPDLLVAVAMAALALWGAGTVLSHARRELRTAVSYHH